MPKEIITPSVEFLSYQIKKKPREMKNQMLLRSVAAPKQVLVDDKIQIRL